MKFLHLISFFANTLQRLRQPLQKLRRVPAVHLNVMELKRDGQSYSEPMLSVFAPREKRIAVNAGILVDNAVDFGAGNCRRANYCRAFV